MYAIIAAVSSLYDARMFMMLGLNGVRRAVVPVYAPMNGNEELMTSGNAATEVGVPTYPSNAKIEESFTSVIVLL
jgi:hypothetical protein